VVSLLIFAAVQAGPLVYARRLYDEGEYFRAAGEYHRYLYEKPDGPELADALLGLGLCYLHGERWAPAERALQRVPEGPRTAEARYVLGRVYLGQGRRDAARKAFEAGSDTLSRTQLGRMAAEDGDWPGALKRFEEAGAAGPAELVRARLAFRPLSPLVAGLASAVPGGGYLYDGRPLDAFSALVLTGGLAGGAAYYLGNGNAVAGYGLGGLAGVFWAGSAFGAVREAVRSAPEADARVVAGIRDLVDGLEP
jgi:tetratricopeptide (TPR) repeat protein